MRSAIRMAALIGVVALVSCAPTPEVVMTEPANPVTITVARDGPFRTLAAARDEVRRLKASGGFRGATVIVRGGTYVLDETFTLGPDDSGTESAPIVWTAAEGERVVLTGGRTIGGWEPWRDGILRADVRALLPDIPEPAPTEPVQGLEIFFDGRRMDVARWPNHIAGHPRDGEWAYVFTAPENQKRTFRVPPSLRERVARWQDAPGAQVHIWPNYNWRDQFIGIASVDTTQGMVSLAGETAYAIMPGRRYYVRNLLAELDAPGEYFLDRAAGALYFYPPGPVEGHDVRASLVDTLVALDGAEHVTFRGFTVEGCRGTGVAVTDGRDDTIAACTIRNTGGAGVTVSGGARNRVAGCDISENGRGGVIVDGGDRVNLVSAGNEVTNCHIHHYGRLVKCYQAGVVIRGMGNRIAHCLIHDAPHNAILLYGNEHTIELNEIHHVALEGSDTGAFYLGRDYGEQGNVVRWNYFHDILGYGLEGGEAASGTWRYESPHGAWAVYLDDNTSGTLVYGNLFVRIAMGALHLGGGKDNRFEHNISVECYPPAHTDARWKEFYLPDSAGGVMDYMTRNLEKVNYRGPLWSDRYPHLARALVEPRRPAGNVIAHNIAVYSRDNIQGFWAFNEKPEASIVWHLQNLDTASTIIDRNLVWTGGNPVRVEMNPYLDQPGGVYGWDEWRRKGYDVNSRIADPLFVDAANDDYRLRDDSPAWDVGFRRIPVERIGLVEDDNRASWPVDAARRVEQVRKTTETVRLFDIEREGEWHYVRDFLLAGPFPLDWDGTYLDAAGKLPSPSPGFRRAYPPETAAGRRIDATFATVDGPGTWKPASRDESGYLDLLRHFRTTDNVVAYARCTVVVEREIATRLALGSNDGARVWLNGTEIIAVETARGAVPGQEVVPVMLRAGRNEVLVKVTNVGARWGLYLAFDDPERTLRYSAD